MRKILLFAAVCAALSVARSESLDAQFGTPPAASRPWVMWYWMDGQIDRDGITRDLESMARNGIGGVVLGDIGGTDEGPTRFLSPGWKELFAHTLREARRLGLVVSTCPSAGWCALGGPWVEPEDAMQVLVWSTTRMSGPAAFSGVLPRPMTHLDHYRDIAVLAVPSDDDPTRGVKSVTVSGADGDGASLLDGDPSTDLRFDCRSGSAPPRIDIEFSAPASVRGLALEFPAAPRLQRVDVEAEDKDGNFARVGGFAGKFHGGDGVVMRGVAELRGGPFRRLRVVLEGGAKGGMVRVSELDLFGSNFIPEWTVKSGAVIAGIRRLNTGQMARIRAIPESSVIDLTDRMSADGRLNWQAPDGDWTLLRFGHTARGAKNRPAKAGEGLETDKFRKDVTKFHFDQYIGAMAETHREFMGSTFVAMWQDSWETGCQNWSPVFREEFRRRRGYDLLRHLPAMTGRAVGSGDIRERFLWDIRRTIADLAADNYLGALTELGAPHGIGFWFQPLNRHFFDGIQAVGRATGAESNMFFDTRHKPKREYNRDKLCVSAAHGYGHTVIHSEAATVPPPYGIYVETPAAMRELVNACFCAGVNNHWMHVFLHQPWQRAEPGLSWFWGLQFQRNATWFESLGGWSAYVTRGQHMLRQGLPVVDVVAFIGEDTMTGAASVGLVKELNVLPTGIDYDICNAEIVMERMSVRDGRIVLPDGMSYALLYMPPSVTVARPDVLRKILDLVVAGATLVGDPPSASPSLENHPACDREVRSAARELWGVPDETGAGRRVGAGRVFSAASLLAAVSAIGLTEDFSVESAPAGAMIESAHRRTADADIYFVANRLPRVEEAVCSFRVDGRMPELWHPDSGRIEDARAYEVVAGRVRLPLRFDPHGAMFVVFRRPASAPTAGGPIGPNSIGWGTFRARGASPLIRNAAGRTVRLSSIH